MGIIQLIAGKSNPYRSVRKDFNLFSFLPAHNSAALREAKTSAGEGLRRRSPENSARERAANIEAMRDRKWKMEEIYGQTLGYGSLEAMRLWVLGS